MPEVTEKVKTTKPEIAPQKDAKKAPGLQFRRLFTKPGVSPYDEIEWELRLAQITDAKGNVIFEQKDVEVPKDWSMTATNIVASKYLHGKIGTPGQIPVLFDGRGVNPTDAEASVSEGYVGKCAP